MNNAGYYFKFNLKGTKIQLLRLDLVDVLVEINEKAPQCGVGGD